ncbi:hypothetical protein GCM10010313_19420 [Streptomyces violarus]|nr:hypothetical protein GCM10010313_19420 [Streptomyces violarus]
MGALEAIESVNAWISPDGQGPRAFIERAVHSDQRWVLGCPYRTLAWLLVVYQLISSTPALAPLARAMARAS